MMDIPKLPPSPNMIARLVPIAPVQQASVSLTRSNNGDLTAAVTVPSSNGTALAVGCLLGVVGTLAVVAAVRST